jgi:hypothetical protein
MFFWNEHQLIWAFRDLTTLYFLCLIQMNPMEQQTLDINAGKQLSLAAADVYLIQEFKT